MNPPILPTLAETAGMLRGESHAAAINAAFPLDSLQSHRLAGLTAAPGHAALDSDAAWAAVVRSWWGLGLTWGMVACPENGELSWNLVTPRSLPEADEAVAAHLTGARWASEPRDFRLLADKIGSLPFRAAMAGNSACGPDARPEHALRPLLGEDFVLLVLAKALPRREIESLISDWGRQRQFLRDEYLTRPGLERDNHAAAAACLDLVEAADRRGAESLREGGWLVRTLFAAGEETTFRKARALLHGAYSADGGEPEPLRWQTPEDPRQLTFLNSAEAAALARPPRTEMPGFMLETHLADHRGSRFTGGDVVFANAAPSTEATTGRLAFGRILDDAGHPGRWLDIPIDDLCRHLLIAGMPGSGKSVTCEHLLLTLWLEHRIPWLVIEPGLKTAYRRLLNSEISSDLNVLAIGNPLSPRSPMNPLAVPPGVGLAEHTSALFCVISSAFELVPPMPEVLAKAIEQTYRNHGWNLAGLVPQDPPPLFADLVHEVDRQSRETGHSKEVTGNIRAGLLLRLGRLLEGPLEPELSSSQGIDIAAITRQPTIIELSCLPDAGTQALVMGFLALQLRHHWRLAGPSDSLRHFTVIEEAHRLLKAVPETAANAARTRAVEDLAHMLAELRGFGVGLAVVDQAPSILAPSVIANTGTKILHRLDHPADRELAGRSAGLPADQVDLLGALKPGEAILRSDTRPKPFRVRIPNPAVTYGKLPLPVLETPVATNAAPGVHACPACRDKTCHAYWIGSQKQALKTRIQSLMELERSPDQLIKDWVTSQLPTTEIPPSPHNPRCFIIGLGQVASLEKATIRRFLTALNQIPTSP